jgi:hypothetical protein
MQVTISQPSNPQDNADTLRPILQHYNAHCTVTVQQSKAKVQYRVTHTGISPRASFGDLTLSNLIPPRPNDDILLARAVFYLFSLCEHLRLTRNKAGDTGDTYYTVHAYSPLTAPPLPSCTRLGIILSLFPI